MHDVMLKTLKTGIGPMPYPSCHRINFGQGKVSFDLRPRPGKARMVQMPCQASFDLMSGVIAIVSPLATDS